MKKLGKSALDRSPPNSIMGAQKESNPPFCCRLYYRVGGRREKNFEMGHNDWYPSTHSMLILPSISYKMFIRGGIQNRKRKSSGELTTLPKIKKPVGMQQFPQSSFILSWPKVHLNFANMKKLDGTFWSTQC